MKTSLHRVEYFSDVKQRAIFLPSTCVMITNAAVTSSSSLLASSSCSSSSSSSSLLELSSFTSVLHALGTVPLRWKSHAASNAVKHTNSENEITMSCMWLEILCLVSLCFPLSTFREHHFFRGLGLGSIFHILSPHRDLKKALLKSYKPRTGLSSYKLKYNITDFD